MLISLILVYDWCAILAHLFCLNIRTIIRTTFVRFFKTI